MGYDCEERVYELLRTNVGFDEDIRFMSFLEDHIPTYIFIITYNHKEQQSIFRILKLKKNKAAYETFKIDESKETITENIIDHINSGTFVRTRKKSIDNLELLPKNDGLFPADITGNEDDNVSRDTSYLLKKKQNNTTKHVNGKSYNSMANMFPSNGGGIASMHSLNNNGHMNSINQ